VTGESIRIISSALVITVLIYRLTTVHTQLFDLSSLNLQSDILGECRVPHSWYCPDCYLFDNSLNSKYESWIYLVRNRRKTSRFRAGIRAVIGRFRRVQPVSNTNRGGPSARCNETVSGAPLGRSMVSPSSRPLWIPSEPNSATPESSEDRDNGSVPLPVS